MPNKVNAMSQPLGELVPNWTAPPRPSAELFQGQYCRLELLDAVRHGDSLYHAIAVPGDEGSWTYMAYGPFQSRADYGQWLNQYCGREDPRFYAIVSESSGQALGVAAYLRITPAAGSIEVGHIHWSPTLRRTPAATEAMFLMMRYAFELGYRRYEWKCDTLNRPSREAAVRFGFTFEGIFRQFSVVKGRNRDTAWYAIIDREWPMIEQGYQRWLNASNFDATGQQIHSLAECLGRC